MRTAILLVLSGCLFSFSTGCAKYEYDIIEPEDLAGHIGSRADHDVGREPLVYRLRAYDNRLVMRVFNETDEPIHVQGDRSFVVDPEGQSRPLRSQTIAPRAFIKLIFPPVRPYWNTGPSVGFGVGYVVSSSGRNSNRSSATVVYRPRFHDQPRYYSLNDGGEVFWDWRGEGSIRLTLVFEREGANETFSHSFVFQRKKMN
jgi:hypothetical protein